MEIYVDVLICENFIINLFLIFITMQVLKHKTKKILLVCSGMVGAVYTLVLLIPKLHVLTLLPFKLLILYIMIRISYGKSSIINIIKAMSIFLLLTFTLAGLCFMFSIKQNNYIVGSTFEISKQSIKYILISGMIIYMFLNRLVAYIKNKIFVDNYKFSIEFIVENRKYEIKSFLDTGNELREPVTNLPCILIEEEFIANINFNTKNTYYVPYTSIGNGGNLKGIKVEAIQIKGEHSYNKIDAIICPCNQKLSKEDDFNALLSRGVV